MPSSPSRFLAAVAFLLACQPAQAFFHLWTLNEIFSNADGSVQFVELGTAFGSQQFVSGHAITSSSGMTSNNFVFLTDLPGDTAGKKFLIGTTGFAALGLVTPDYVVPNGFLFAGGGTVNFAGVDIWIHPPLPTDSGLSLNRDGSLGTNSPTNFAGATGQVPATSYRLTVTRAGTGSGTVSSVPAGVDCGATCLAVFASGTPVALSATPGAGSLFTGWGGACAGTGTCDVTLGQVRTVTATFDLDPADSDGDGIPNGVEVLEGRNPMVKDNDVFGFPRLFAMQQYRDFLGREGDAGGITFYETGLTNGSLTGPQVVENFFLSPEFGGIVAPVTRLYFAFFNRIPDYPGLQFQVNAYRTGTPLTVIANNFSLSPEFVATYGALTDPQYVTLLYQNVLGRTPVQSEVDFHVARLTGGVTRGEVMVGFSESPEYQTLKFNAVYVTNMYVGMLRRSPEQAGFDFWVLYMAGGSSGQALIAGFLNAPEYAGRFLP